MRAGRRERLLYLDAKSDWAVTDIDLKALDQLVTINKSVWGQSYNPLYYIEHAEEILGKTGVSKYWLAYYTSRECYTEKIFWASVEHREACDEHCILKSSS